jgi:hypothetical protein
MDLFTFVFKIWTITVIQKIMVICIVLFLPLSFLLAFFVIFSVVYEITFKIIWPTTMLEEYLWFSAYVMYDLKIGTNFVFKVM